MSVRLHVAGSTFELAGTVRGVADYIENALYENATADIDTDGWTAIETTDGFVHVRLHPSIDIAISATR